MANGIEIVKVDPIDQTTKSAQSPNRTLGLFLWLLSILSVGSIISFTLFMFPVHMAGDNLKMTNHIVDQLDQSLLYASVVPFFVILFVWQISDHLRIDVSRATKFWVPRFVFQSPLFATWSYGDGVGMVIVFLLNMAWWFVPVYSRITNPPSHSHGEHTEMNLRKVFDIIAGWAGMAGMFDVGFAIILAARENAFAKTLVGKDAGQYHRGLKYHIVFGYYALFMETLHTVYYLIVYAVDNKFGESMFPWVDPYGFWNFMGLIGWICMMIMAFTAIFKVRRWNYRLFYWSHQLYIPFLLFSVLHYYICWYAFIGPVGYFLFDRFVPRLLFRRSTKAVITKVSDMVTRVDIDTSQHGLLYRPGDWINLLVPEISNFNWHPFSIESLAEDNPNVATVFVKNLGPWTCALASLATREGKVINVKVDGPFGAHHQYYEMYQKVYFVAAGTGMAALSPFIRSLSKQGKSISVHWVAKSMEDVVPYYELLHSAKSMSDFHIHLTRNSKPPKSPTGTLNEASTIQIDLKSKSVEKSLFGQFKNVLSMRLLLVFLVAIGTVGGYIWGRLMMFDFDMDYCMSPESYLAGGKDQFLCWYYYYWAPTMFPVLLTLLLAFGWTFLVESRRPTLVCDYSIPQIMDADSVEACCEISSGRPDFKTIFQEDGHQAAVLVAGPKSMVDMVELATIPKGYTVFNESWKVCTFSSLGLTHYLHQLRLIKNMYLKKQSCL
jgi:NAD(P)H-flavin reductase/DMSO/TMAO reductase YedYZ heme-binding membrane subunit